MNSYDDYEGIPMCDRTHSEYSLMLQPNTDSSDWYDVAKAWFLC